MEDVKHVCVELAEGAGYAKLFLKQAADQATRSQWTTHLPITDPSNCESSIEWWEIVCSLLLICLSGLFSGLTLGLLGLDPVGLEVVKESGTKDAAYAKVIAPMRKRGNLLLCTLLLGNVAVNAALSILLANISSGLVGFFLSTGFIVIFGEIVPQATCARYALYVGAKTIWIVKFFLVLLFPVTWPIAKILDLALGEELGTIYNKNELKTLVEIHVRQAQSDLQIDTGKIMRGAINFQGKTAFDVMTSWEDVFTINETSVLDFQTLTKIFKSGHSRIPCISEDPQRGTQVTGLLFVKDLILLDPEDEVPVSSILDVFDHPMLHVWPDYKLDKLLNDFCTGRSHLAIVRDVVNSGEMNSKKMNSDDNRDPYYVNRGLVTLEDLLEIILQRAIVDETDVFIDIHSKSKKRARPEFDMTKLSIFDYRPQNRKGMSPQEVNAVFNHLRAQCPILSRECGHKLTDRAFKNLLGAAEVTKIVCEHSENSQQAQRDPYRLVDESGLLLYKRGTATSFFSLVLDGKVEVHAGKQGFRCELARWTILCPDVLEAAAQRRADDPLQKDETDITYTPDFTCRIVKNSRILRVPAQMFIDALAGKFEVAVQIPQQRKARALDTTGDGREDAWALDTTGDGQEDTLLRKMSEQNFMNMRGNTGPLLLTRAASRKLSQSRAASASPRIDEQKVNTSEPERGEVHFAQEREEAGSGVRILQVVDEAPKSETVR